MHVLHLPVGQLQAMDDLVGRAGRERAAKDLVDERTIVRVDRGEEGLVGGAEAPGIDPEDPVDLIGPAQRAVGEVELPAAELADPLGLAQVALAGRQRAGAPALVAHVLAHADQPPGLPGVGAQDLIVPLDLALLARGGDDRVGEAAGRVAVERPAEAGPHALALAGGQEGREPVRAGEVRERAADQRLEAGVGVVDPAREVEHEHDQRRGLDDRDRKRAVDRPLTAMARLCTEVGHHLTKPDHPKENLSRRARCFCALEATIAALTERPRR